MRRSIGPARWRRRARRSRRPRAPAAGRSRRPGAPAASGASRGASRAGPAGRSLLETLTGRTLVSVRGPGLGNPGGRVGGGGDTELDVIVTVELGDTSYLLVSEGEAVLVDPQRDAWRFVAAAEARRATHPARPGDPRPQRLRLGRARGPGAPTGARDRGARPAAATPSRTGRWPRATRSAVGDRHADGVETPGPHPRAPVVRGAGAAAPTTRAAVFTGGSLIVGPPAEPTCSGPDRTDELTRAQFRSLRRLAGLPDDVRVLPDARRRELLLRGHRRRRAHVHDRGRAPREPGAGASRRGRLRPPAHPGLPRVPLVLPVHGADQPRRPAPWSAGCPRCRRSAPRRSSGWSRPARGWWTRATARRSPRPTSRVR